MQQGASVGVAPAAAGGSSSGGGSDSGGSDVVVSATGVFGEERRELRRVCARLGAAYSGDLTPQTAALVVHGDWDPTWMPVTLKIQRALEWGVPLVGPGWVADSAARGALLPIERYRLQVPAGYGQQAQPADQPEAVAVKMSTSPDALPQPPPQQQQQEQHIPGAPAVMPYHIPTAAAAVGSKAGERATAAPIKIEARSSQGSLGLVPEGEGEGDPEIQPEVLRREAAATGPIAPPLASHLVAPQPDSPCGALVVLPPVPLGAAQWPHQHDHLHHQQHRAPQHHREEQQQQEEEPFVFGAATDRQPHHQRWQQLQQQQQQQQHGLLEAGETPGIRAALHEVEPSSVGSAAASFARRSSAASSNVALPQPQPQHLQQHQSQAPQLRPHFATACKPPRPRGHGAHRRIGGGGGAGGGSGGDSGDGSASLLFSPPAARRRSRSVEPPARSFRERGRRRAGTAGAPSGSSGGGDGSGADSGEVEPISQATPGQFADDASPARKLRRVRLRASLHPRPFVLASELLQAGASPAAAAMGVGGGVGNGDGAGGLLSVLEENPDDDGYDGGASSGGCGGSGGIRSLGIAAPAAAAAGTTAFAAAARHGAQNNGKEGEAEGGAADHAVMAAAAALPDMSADAEDALHGLAAMTLGSSSGGSGGSGSSASEGAGAGGGADGDRGGGGAASAAGNNGKRRRGKAPAASGGGGSKATTADAVPLRQQGDVWVRPSGRLRAAPKAATAAQHHPGRPIAYYRALEVTLPLSPPAPPSSMPAPSMTSSKAAPGPGPSNAAATGTTLRFETGPQVLSPLMWHGSDADHAGDGSGGAGRGGDSGSSNAALRTRAMGAEGGGVATAATAAAMAAASSPARIAAVYELEDTGEVWVQHVYFFTAHDYERTRQRLLQQQQQQQQQQQEEGASAGAPAPSAGGRGRRGGGASRAPDAAPVPVVPVLAPGEVVKGAKVYHSPASSVTGAAYVYRSRAAYARRVAAGGLDVVMGRVWWCEKLQVL